MDEENKTQINDAELEEVSGGIWSYWYRNCPKCRRIVAREATKCKYCGAKLKGRWGRGNYENADVQ